MNTFYLITVQSLLFPFMTIVCWSSVLDLSKEVLWKFRHGKAADRSPSGLPSPVTLISTDVLQKSEDGVPIKGQPFNEENLCLLILAKYVLVCRHGGKPSKPQGVFLLKHNVQVASVSVRYSRINLSWE